VQVVFVTPETLAEIQKFWSMEMPEMNSEFSIQESGGAVPMEKPGGKVEIGA